MKTYRGTIAAKALLAPDTYDFTLRCPEAAAQPWTPGQFLHIGVPGRFLRRPISIAGINGENGTLRIIFRAVGTGTRILAGLAVGTTLDFLWPLGRGYRLPEAGSILLVGGGLGVAPLLALGDAFPGREFHAVAGFRSANEVYGLDDLSRFCASVRLVTDDGSAGERGFVTQHLPVGPFAAVLACGPVPMLRALQGVALPAPCQISLEERMACGLGACDGCACKVHRQDGYDHVRVCAEGPVFNLTEVQL